MPSYAGLEIQTLCAQENKTNPRPPTTLDGGLAHVTEKVVNRVTSLIRARQSGTPRLPN